MPIYAYKCDACGLAKDVLQKMSDDALTECPACAAPRFRKQLTAPGFQLKGTGWYATDFKGGDTTTAPAATDSAAPADAVAQASDSTSTSTSASAAVASSAPASGCAPSCACH
jgi:putative FmdB family regulatory protein